MFSMANRRYSYRILKNIFLQLLWFEIPRQSCALHFASPNSCSKHFEQKQIFSVYTIRLHVFYTVKVFNCFYSVTFQLIKNLPNTFNERTQVELWLIPLTHLWSFNPWPEVNTVPCDSSAAVSASTVSFTHVSKIIPGDTDFKVPKYVWEEI